MQLHGAAAMTTWLNFCRARPATGFSNDLRELARLMPGAGSNAPSFRATVGQLYGAAEKKFAEFATNRRNRDSKLSVSLTRTVLIRMAIVSRT